MTAAMRAALALFLAAAAPVSAETPAPETGAPFEASYEVYIGGLKVGALTLGVERGGARYAASARMEAAGLASWLFPGAAEAEAFGADTPRGLAPEAFVADGRFGDAAQRVEMDFGATGLALAAEPPLRARDYDADLAAMGDALDPLSAAVAALAPAPAAAVCDRTLSVFDSRRRFDLLLGPAVESGGTLRCEGRFRRVAGYKDKHLRQPDQPFTAWFSVNQDGAATLMRAQAPTDFGHAVAVRRSATGL
ncbi:DUF3108 domain-containing protein [Rubrimonas cliftonensis]|uniref:DUF3108 domain-containing protein n=1 Tax=Rubrimonas cliftonensis TaxID=89524 RepID=A0A1H4AQK6_9RHOB|nr:DUF3108 domain-containing protein [Rubrimonas cliftonensis]SEA38176.1 Protein of unknown function [Rubrimonas cliftonensis]